MALNALRRLVGQSGSAGVGASDFQQAQQLSSLELGVLDLGLGLKRGQLQTLTASNVYDALSQSTRDLIKSFGNG